MRSLKSGLIAIALSGIFGTLAVIGCSASGADDGIGTGDLPNDPSMMNTSGGGSALPPKTDDGSGDASVKDAGKKDSGKTEAGVNAGPPPPVEGTPCPTLNAFGTKNCGACGKAQTVCLPGGDGGGGLWSPYGACSGELLNGCTPGTTQACGNCGTQTCSQYCGFGSCTGQPANSCAPGTVAYTNAGCGPGTYHSRTCSATCAYGNFSLTCDAPVNDLVLNIPTTVGATASKTITFSTAKMGSRLSGFTDCPSLDPLETGDYPYQYVELHNSTAKAAKVTIYASAAPAGAVIDTIMAAYSTALQPMDDPSKLACAYGVDDESDSSVDPTGNDHFSILKTVPIAAGSSILVNVASYYENPTAGEPTLGDLNINVKVEQLN